MHRWWLIALVGCYRPAAIDECTATCGADPGRVCPPDQTCDDNGLCKPLDMAGNCPPREAGLDAFEPLDAPIDAANPGQHCFAGFFPVCIDKTLPDLTYPPGVTEIDTNGAIDQCTFLQPQAQPPSVCVIAANNIVIGSGVTLRLVGPYPVAFVAYGTIDIQGTIDASSKRLGRRGAGSLTATPCTAAAAGVKATAIGGGGGGAGGALQYDGGAGGTGTGGSSGGVLTKAVTTLKTVRGGCSGAHGGSNANGQGAGVFGAGGGAVHFVARVDIELLATAIINASGAGGSVASTRAGGGGGGSGGFIGFEAPSIVVAAAAQIFAIGGGGSAGGGNTADGNPGEEAIAPAPTPRAVAKDGGGYGGAGASLAAEGGGPGVPAGSTAGGGGGGGGGGGLIGSTGQGLTTGVIAPPPRPL